MRDRRNKKTQKKEGSKLPYLLSSLLTMFFLGFILYFVDPKTPLIVPVFFIFVFLTTFFILSIFLKPINMRILISSYVVIILLLRLLKIGNLVNIFLLTAITITILTYEYYSKKSN